MAERFALPPGARMWDGNLHVGRRTLEWTRVLPTNPHTTVVMAPGIVAKRRVYAAFANELARLGYETISTAHADAVGCYPDEVAAALDAVQSSVFIERATDQIVGYGHSKGGANMVLAVHDDMTRTDKLVLQSPAGFGGVQVLRAVDSVARELRHMSGQALKIGEEAAGYIVRNLPAMGKLAIDAATVRVGAEASELLDQGMSLSAIETKDDGLVNPRQLRRVLEGIGVRIVPVEAPYVGHNAQIYHPHLVAVAFDEALQGERQAA